MSGFETRFRAEDDADHIRAAFYGFVGAHEADVDGDAHISTEIDTQGPKLRVRLWSAEAMDAFLSSLYATARPDRRACYE
jgi:hypothetical protein